MRAQLVGKREGFKVVAILLALLGLAYFLGSLWVGLPQNDLVHITLNDPVETMSWHPRVFRYRNFITEEEADHIRELAAPLVTRSEVVVAEGEPAVHEARTSSGVFLTGDLSRDPIVQRVAQKIALWTQIPEGHGEAFYVIRYEKGQQYLPHMDWFDDSPASKPYIGENGQRIATVLTYLSTPEAGGETIFPDAENGPLTTPAKKGDAILFWDVLPDGTEDPKSMHGGRPVIAGIKWCMTRWIREKNSLNLQKK